MTVVVNGRELSVTEPLSLEELIASLKLAVSAFAVELNRKVIPRRDHAVTLLHAGDRIEIVTLVGGG